MELFDRSQLKGTPSAEQQTVRNVNLFIFRDITLCSLLNVNRRFGGTCRTALIAAGFMLVSCLAYSSAMKMEEACSSDPSVDFQRTTHGTLHNHRCENFKSYMLNL
jgi:hypothetical protein